MRAFAQRIRVRVHESHLRAQRSYSHQKAQDGPGIPYIKFLDVTGMPAKALNDNLLFILRKHCSKIGNTSADRIAVLTMCRIVDRADALG